MSQGQTLQGLSHQAREAKSWPFEQARLLLDRILRLRLSDAERDLAASLIGEGKAAEAVRALPALTKPVIFQCGFGASGLPHMGTFGEATRPTIVRTAFRALTEDAIPTKLIVFSDDMDGLRKIPDNVPNREMLEEDRDKPVTSVRDPFGEHESFGAHNNARLRAFLDGFGFDYEFMSSTECYASGRFDEVLLRILARFDAVQAIMLPTLGEERRATYSPFLPISPRTGQVLQVPILERDAARGTIAYRDPDPAHRLLRRHGRPEEDPGQRAQQGDAGGGPRQAGDVRPRPLRRVRELRRAQQRPPARLPRQLRL
jgi:lysyl-tRNA synthetase class 1